MAPAPAPTVPDAPEDMWKQLGNVVYQRRQVLGLKKSEASRRAGISDTTWRRIENGEHDNPSDSSLIRVARALRVNPTELLAIVGREPVDHQLVMDTSASVQHPAVDYQVETVHDEAFRVALEHNPALSDKGREALWAFYRFLLER